MKKAKNNNSTKTTNQNKLPAWDLSDLYDGIDDPQVEKDLTSYARMNKSLARKYKGKLATLEPRDFYLSLKDVEKINVLGSKLGVFAYLNMVTQMKNPQAVAFYQNVDEKMTEASKPAIFYTLEINALGDDKFRELLKNKDYQKQMAFAVFCGINRFFTSVTST